MCQHLSKGEPIDVFNAHRSSPPACRCFSTAPDNLQPAATDPLLSENLPRVRNKSSRHRKKNNLKIYGSESALAPFTSDPTPNQSTQRKPPAQLCLNFSFQKVLRMCDTHPFNSHHPHRTADPPSRVEASRSSHPLSFQPCAYAGLETPLLRNSVGRGGGDSDTVERLGALTDGISSHRMLFPGV